MPRLAAALAAAVLVACSPKVTPTNPYDPETPPEQQARGQVRGAALVAGGGPAARVTVVLRQGGPVVRQTATAGDGVFLFDAVVPGSYTLELAPTGFVPLSIPLAVAPGEDLQLGTVSLTPASAASAIEGTAVLAGEADHGGTLVEAVGRAYTAVTNSEGRFRLEVAEGTYTLRMSHQDYLSVTVEDVTVARGEVLQLDAVTLAANPATISGHVDGERADGTWGPLADAAVTLEGTALTGFTNAAGDFTLTGVSPGSYLLHVFRDGWSDARVPVLDLDGGEGRTLAEPFALALSRGGLAGSVSLADTADASGIVVEVAGTTRATVTGSDGAFSFDGLLEGAYALSAHRDGYARRDLGTWSVSAGRITAVAHAALTRLGGAVSVAEGAFVNTRAIQLVTVAGGAGWYKASEDPALPGAWLPLPAGGRIPFTLADRDGEHTVWVVLSADAVTAGTPASAAVVLDRQRPTAPSVVVGDGTGWSRAPGGIVSLALSALDLPPSAGVAVSGVSRMALSNDAAFTAPEVRDYALTATWTLATPGVDGPKAVWVRFIDRAGNVSDPVSAAVTLDRIAPANPALSLAGPPPSPAGLTTSPVVSATLAAVDANRPLLVRLSNTPGFEGSRYQTLASPASWTLLPGDAEKTVYAQFMDPAGNESLPVPATITLDTRGPFDPVVTIVEADARPGDGWTNVLGVAVSLSAGGMPTAAQVSEDPTFGTGVTVVQMTGLPQPVSTPFTLGGSGQRTVYVRFQDDAGNWSATASARVTVDATRPADPTLAVQATLADGTPSSRLAGTSVVVLALSATDDAVEMATAQGAACGAPWAASWYPLSPSTVLVLDPPDGEKTVCVRTRDRAGNESRIATATVELDTTPPSNPAFRDLASGVTNEPSVSGTLITASVDPPHAASTVGYQCLSTATGAWGACTGTAPTFRFPLQRNVPNVVGIRARDAAGNVSAGTLVSVVHDDTPPLPPRVTNVQTAADSITLEWQPSADTDIDHYLVSYGTSSGDFAGDGAAQGGSPVRVAATGGRQGFTLTGLDTGTVYYVAVEAVDRAGNGSGPSGQIPAAPNVVNPRVVGSWGARPRQLTALVDGGRVFAYLATTQGVVQLDATSQTAPPAVVGRATVPNIVPDVPPVAFPCTRSGTAGHCVILAGTTPEGEYLRRTKEDRAFAPVVFFRTNGSASAPAVGELASQLAARAHWLVYAALGGVPVVFAPERGRVVAFDLGDPGFPRRLGAVALPVPVNRVVEAALQGDTLYLYGQSGDGSRRESRLQRVTVAAAPAFAMAAADLGVLVDDEGTPLGTGEILPVATFRTGLYVAYQRLAGPAIDVWLCRYAPASLGTPSCARVGAGGQWTYPQYAFTSNGYVNVLAWSAPERGQSTFSLFRAREGTPPVPVGGAPFLTGMTTALPTAVAFGAAASSTDRLLVLGRGDSADPDGVLERWTLAGEAAPASAPGYAYTIPRDFAESNGFLYAVHGDAIDVVDISNPLAPTPASVTTRAGRSYSTVQVYGPWLFAVAETAIDVFLRDARGGLALRRTVSTPARTDAMAFADGLMLAAVSNRILVLNLVSDLDGVPLELTVPSGIGAIAAVSRSADAWPTTVFTASSDRLFRAYAFNGSALWLLGTAPVPAPMSWIEVAGPMAAVSWSEGTTTIDVSNPAALRVLQSGLPVTGAHIQSGYLVGNAGSGQSSGPVFVAYAANGAVHGSSPYARCTWDRTLHRDGAYLAKCEDGGILLLSAADGRHAKVLARHDLSETWKGASLVVDGHDAYVGGAVPAHETDDPFPLYRGSVEGNAGGNVSPPVATGVVTTQGRAGRQPVPRRWPQWMLAREGLIWSFEWTETTRVASLVTYETASTVDPWRVRASFDLATPGEFTAQPVTDGSWLYVAREGEGDLPPVVEAYDARIASGPAPTPTATWAPPSRGSGRSLAVSRERLYAGLEVYGGAPYIAVLDVRDPSASPALPALAPVAGSAVDAAATTVITGLAVSGRWLFYTYRHDPPYPNPFVFGLRVVELGANRDGAGARLVGEVTSRFPLANPTVSADRLFVSSNLGVGTYDLDPLFRSGAMPTLLQALTPPEALAAWEDTRLVIDGPFAYLAGAGYRVYDLR